jgi:hypothetical protein
MPANKPPETWSWSHDIKPTQIDSVLTPGSRLVRLSSYGEGNRRRFAALAYAEPGAERRYALDLDAGKLAALGARPVAITVDADPASPKFTVVLDSGPGPRASVHVDLDDAGLRALVDDQHGVADLATYVAGGARKYAAIVEARPGPTWLFTGVAAAELDAALLAHDAALTRLRAYTDDGRTRLVAVAEPARGARWAWYAELDGDGVAKQLEANAAYPFDLDATRGDRGVRFTVVMYRQT